MISQNRKVLTALQACGELGLSARTMFLALGVYRASGRIYDLRKMGYKIRMERRPGQMATYYLKDVD